MNSTTSSARPVAMRLTANASVVLAWAPAQTTEVETAGATTYSVRSAQSQVTYHIAHNRHRVDAISKQVEGRARILTNGQAQVMVRVPAGSFESGNSNRDAHAKEIIEAERFPSVDFKAYCEGLLPPTSQPAADLKICKVQIKFRGVQKNLDIPVRVEFQSAERVHVTGNLVLSLDEFKIERSRLRFARVDDDLRVDVALTFIKPAMAVTHAVPMLS